MILNGAEILVECLKEQGVDTIFGFPGGAVLNIYDALYKYQQDIKHILVSHEQGAAHAADGYARATGKVGVCLATSGPGATNLVTGIATAYMDSIPMVAITGNVTRPLIGRDSFQEVDITGITMPITKHNFMVRDVKELPNIIREAFHIAREGRPGPVLVDIPKDVTAQKDSYERVDPKAVELSNKYITAEAIAKAVKLINEAERPLIYVGGGIISSGASDELIEFAEKINSPVSSSLMALGGFPANHRLHTGMIGMHGTKASNLSATKCDLFIAIGARFSDRVISNEAHISNAKIIHIDIDLAEINKNVNVDSYIIGDLKEVLKVLIPKIEKKSCGEWIKKVEELQKLSAIQHEDSEAITPHFVIEKLNELTNADAIIATDVGQHQMWIAQYYKFYNPRTFITSGGLGTMGFGLGAAIGAKAAMPDKKVVCVSGDGSFMMNCNELATAVSANLPVVILVMNNHALGMVHQWQQFFYEERYSHSIIEKKTDFVKLAEAYSAKGLRITSKEQVVEVLKEALDSDVPVVIDCLIEAKRKVLPMVAPGAPIDQLICE